jgi:glutaredoxin
VTETFLILTKKDFDCMFCVLAVKLLDQKGLRYTLKALPREDLIELGVRTVPHITAEQDGRRHLIGGYDALVSYINEKEQAA